MPHVIESTAPKNTGAATMRAWRYQQEQEQQQQ
jgi:hypothetical protein